MNRTKYRHQPLPQLPDDFIGDCAALFELEAERDAALAQAADHKAKLEAALASKLASIDADRTPLTLRIKRYAEAHRDEIFVNDKGKFIKSKIISGLKIGFRMPTPKLDFAPGADDKSVASKLIDFLPANLLEFVVETTRKLRKQPALKIITAQLDDLTLEQKLIGTSLIEAGVAGYSQIEEFFIDRPAPKDGVTKQEDTNDQ
jgi:phage host-nuclease inhibitor protein Gam